MKNNCLILFCLLLLSATLAACKTHEGAYGPKHANEYDLENSEPLVLADKAVQRSVSVTGVQQTTLPDGRLRVSANIRNRESRRIQVQVNCVFKDVNGFGINDETPFQNLILTENLQEDVTFTSMNDKAKKFTIRVRQAH